jgi:hypothetical protein
MEISEKTRILLAAVHAAAAKGFDFLEWYQRTLNIIPSAKMSEETRLAHLCHLGIEKMLLIDIEFLVCLKKHYQGLLLRIVYEKDPIHELKRYLVNTGILSE